MEKKFAKFLIDLQYLYKYEDEFGNKMIAWADIQELINKNMIT